MVVTTVNIGHCIVRHDFGMYGSAWVVSYTHPEASGDKEIKRRHFQVYADALAHADDVNRIIGTRT